MDPERYTSDAEAFTRALNAEHFLAGAGLKAGLNIAPIYEWYLHLFEGERFEEAKGWDLEPTQQQYLADFIATGHLENLTREITERLAAAESAAAVDWDERAVAYRDVPALIANEPDAVRRHALEQRHLDVMATFNPLLEEREKQVQREARSFGYPDYVALYDNLRALDLAWLTEKMQGFISATDELYFSALDTYLREMGILRDDARRCDISRVFRAPGYDLFFDKKRILYVLHATLRDLGILLEDQSNIRLDTRERPLKLPRAFCCAVRVPEDIRLVVKPSGGVRDYQALLHEAGHAEHYAHIERTLPFPYRRLGDSSVTESYAFLMEYLLHDRLWLRRQLGCTQADSFLRLAGFQKLYFLRRYGTKLVYEQELHRADEPSDMAALYDELFCRNLGVSYGPESYLTDVDDGFYAAQYVRAWIFEAQHRKYLKSEYDDEWFRNPKAGKFLIELWRDGQRYSVDQLARFMGLRGLDLGSVTEEVRLLMGAR